MRPGVVTTFCKKESFYKVDELIGGNLQVLPSVQRQRTFIDMSEVNGRHFKFSVI